MTSDVKTPDPLRDTIRADAREASTASWWLVALGALWIWFGMFVLSYQVGSLVAVATFVGTAFLFGGVTQLVVASRVPTMRWLSIVGGIAGGSRRHRHLRLARHHPLRRVDHGGLVPDRLRHHPPRQRAGRSQAVVVVDRAAARHLRAGAGGVGSPLLGALAGDAGDPGRSVGHLPRGERDLRRLQPATGRQAGGPSWSPDHRSSGQFPRRFPTRGQRSRRVAPGTEQRSRGESHPAATGQPGAAAASPRAQQAPGEPGCRPDHPVRRLDEVRLHPSASGSARGSSLGSRTTRSAC